jgi:hypothetical protein
MGKTVPNKGVLAFYSNTTSSLWCAFSNFYQNNKACHGFDFEIPSKFLKLGINQNKNMVGNKKPLEFTPTVVHCDFSEKAIMLCKAAVMGDPNTYTCKKPNGWGDM